ncbi:MAG: autotransporter outer membrane beta-barrel domain-containing protein, partial [Azoarcus sp.]|nr:autotransporter outer membrane beta-barrel domain-containing protein [Azoarcus sp.]
THNRFGAAGQAWSLNRAGAVKGDGDIRYAGGGLLAHYDADRGFYIEATVRTGQVETDFKSRDLVDYLGRYAKYDAQMRYTGAHMGAGREWKIGEGRALGVHGQYFWLRQESERVTLSTGDSIKFEAMDSERLRVGLRFSQKVLASWSGYAGIACEYEFDGKARASANTVAARYAIDAPKVDGATGIAEAGFTVKQSQSFPVGIDIGLQGYGGQRRGLTGSLSVNRVF